MPVDLDLAPQVGPPAPAGQSRPRRYHKTADKLVDSPGQHIRVVADILAHSVKRTPSSRAIGWRDTIKVHRELRDVKKVRPLANAPSVSCHAHRLLARRSSTAKR